MPTTKRTNARAATRATSTPTNTTGPKEVPYTQRIVTLIIGDAMVFLIFAAIGRGSHGESTGLAALPQIVTTAAPFAIGWFVVAPFVGAYRRNILTQPRTMAIRTAIAWLCSWPVGLALRGIFVDHDIPPLSFALITLLFNMIVLLVWRFPFALTNNIRQREAQEKEG